MATVGRSSANRVFTVTGTPYMGIPDCRVVFCYLKTFNVMYICIVDVVYECYVYRIVAEYNMVYLFGISDTVSRIV